MIWGKENPSTKRQICMGTKKKDKNKKCEVLEFDYLIIF